MKRHVHVKAPVCKGSCVHNRGSAQTFVSIICVVFPTCQVRVVGFHVSCPARLVVVLLLLRHLLNCKLVIAVIPAGLQLQAPDRSGPRRIRASQQAPDQSGPRRTSTTKNSEDIPDRMPERMSEDMPGTYARNNVR